MNRTIRCQPPSASALSGFTLVELLVSMTVLVLIMLIASQMVEAVAKLAGQTRSRVEAFQESRVAFESMTRKISQAMLNTYWDYEYNNGASAAPTGYVRRSELHFLTGSGKHGDPNGKILDPVSGLQTTTHAIFFHAPQGFSSKPQSAGSASTSSPILPNLLNASGFFLSYDSDLRDRPLFLQSGAGIPAERWRFRLMEMLEPSESFRNYDDLERTQTTPNPGVDLRQWFQGPLSTYFGSQAGGSQSTAPSPVRVLCENVIALIIWPRLSPNDIPKNGTAPVQLCPNYWYGSRAYSSQPGDPQSALWGNQLPPIVQVTMVALDEQSASRLQETVASSTPKQMPETQLGLDTLFQAPSSSTNVLITDPAFGDTYRADLATLEATLFKLKLNHRVFTTDVSILQSKWEANSLFAK